LIVKVEGGASDQQADQLAERLGVELVAEPSCPDDSVTLRYRDGVLQAVTVDQSGSEMTVSADYVEYAGVRRRRQAQGELLIKAIQGRHRGTLTILDATMGMAADTMLLTTMGHQVIALEKSRWLFELVSDGLRRAALAGLTRLPELVCAEAVAWLNQHRDQHFDIVYLDPMFAETGKRALPKKNMQLLRQMVELESDGEELLAAAKSRARLRVVVKRPIKGGCLAGSPNYSIKGQRVRFDIYSVG
jgi:16S rRNA (guanine1516-N2)-methyltransferase